MKYLASSLAGALIMCIGVIVYLLRRPYSRTKDPLGLEEPTNPDEPPRILPTNYIEEAEKEADEAQPDPDPDDDDYFEQYERKSAKLDE